MKNVLAVRLRACLKKCVELFASKGSGAFLQTKSDKEKNNSAKGELNINVSYRTNGLSDKIRGTFKGAEIEWYVYVVLGYLFAWLMDKPI